MTSHSHHPTSSIFHCYTPLPPSPVPNKNFDHTHTHIHTYILFVDGLSAMVEGKSTHPLPLTRSWQSRISYIHTYIGRQVSLDGGQLSVPSRCTAVYTWLLTASVTSRRGDPALLSWVDPVLGNLGLPLLVGLGSTGTARCWQTYPVLAKFDRQANLGTC